MTTRHNLSFADQLYWGDAYHESAFASNQRKGVPITPIVKVALGAPGALDADGMIAAATSTELPNAETVTYTTADDGTSPFDNVATPAPSTITYRGSSVSVWALDVPRNITASVTHATSVVAMTITVTGYDKYFVKMIETLSITATGTSKTAAGLKSFSYIQSIALTAAGNAEANTLDLGWGDVLGLPYVLTRKSDLMQVWFNDVLETTAATAVVYDGTTATATTGDVRGTIDLNSALDGSTVAIYMTPYPQTRASLFGVDQYGG